jgi:hypothetical protein
MPHTGNGNGVKTQRRENQARAAINPERQRIVWRACWSPVLPCIETEADWQARLAAVTASLKPATYLEQQLAYQAALSLQQWDRLHRYELPMTIRIRTLARELNFFCCHRYKSCGFAGSAADSAGLESPFMRHLA